MFDLEIIAMECSQLVCGKENYILPGLELINQCTPGNNHLEFSSSLYEKGKNSSILKGNRIYYNRIIFPTINI